MKVTQTQRIAQDVVVDVLCDRCGKSCMIGESDLRQPEYGSFVANWGFLSEFDLERWFGDFCQACCKELREWVSQRGGTLNVSSPH